MIACIQCAMEALLLDQKPPIFNETPEQHIARHHPDIAATQARRKELEKALIEKLGPKISPNGQN